MAGLELILFSGLEYCQSWQINVSVSHCSQQEAKAYEAYNETI